MVRCGVHTFYQYKGLVEPYSREEAKGHLIAIIEGVYNALKELHNPPNDIAHLDVRLNNICFTHPPTKQVKLIDLDRCLPSYSPVHINFGYKQSDMYTPADVTWKNFQLDWKCLGLIICFVEDDTVNSEDYHTMLSGGHTIPSHPFVKSLVEKGEWSDNTWPEFKQTYMRTHPSSDVF